LFLNRFCFCSLKTLRTKWHIKFCQKKHITFLAHFPYFETIKVGSCNLHAVCVSLYPPHQILKDEPIFIKIGINIMAHDPISAAYLINPSYQSVCMSVPLPLLGNGSVKTLRLQRIHAQQSKNCWTSRFLCGQCRIKGKQAISSSQNLFFRFPHWKNGSPYIQAYTVRTYLLICLFSDAVGYLD
jgi:hypothetical protein